MLKRTSTIRSKLAIRAAAAVLLAGMLAEPAAAGPDNSPWFTYPGQAARPGNVEQRGRQVNHRNDGHDRGRVPPWRANGGHDGGRQERHVRSRRHDSGHDRGPQYADRDRRHGDDRHRDHGGDRYYYYYRVEDHRHHRGRDRRRVTRNYYNYYYVSPPAPRVILYPVPYHVHRHDEGHRHYYPGTQAPVCQDGYYDGGRYVMGGSHEPGGTILGGIVGAAIGSQIGGGNGRLAAVGVGTLIGAVIGRDIGRSMDIADRAYATGSFGHAMEYAPTCSSITWDNPRTGSQGTVTPTYTYEPEPGRYCREFQQQVTIGGRVEDAYGTACRQPDGSWEIVAEKP